MKAIKETTNSEDVNDLRLETEKVFDCIKDARAYLNDNYTTGEYIILWDTFYGAFIYNSELRNE